MGKVSYGAVNGGSEGGFVISKKIVIAALAVLLVLCVLCGYFIHKSATGSADPVLLGGQMMVDTRASETERAENPIANRSVSFAGINDATISEGDTIML